MDFLCAGDGRLIDHLEKHGGRCTHAYDIEPRDSRVIMYDALLLQQVETPYIITNPPWDRKVLHPMIEHFSSIALLGYYLMQIGCIQNNPHST